MSDADATVTAAANAANGAEAPAAAATEAPAAGAEAEASTPSAPAAAEAAADSAPAKSEAGASATAAADAADATEAPAGEAKEPPAAEAKAEAEAPAASASAPAPAEKAEASSSSFAAAAVAAARGDLATIETLLRERPELAQERGVCDEVPESDASGALVLVPVIGTLLHSACKGGRVEVARVLLDAKADPCSAEAVRWGSEGGGESSGASAADGEELRTPLRLAVWSGSHDLVSLLLERRADPLEGCGSASPSASPLEEAARRGFADISRSLLDAGGARAEAASEDAGGPAPQAYLNRLLLCAIQSNSAETVELLLDRRASVNAAAAAADGGSASPLQVAARTRSPAILGLLLARGADATQEHEEGGCTLALAADARVQFQAFVAAAPEGPEREWRQQMQERHVEAVDVLLRSGTLHVAASSLRYVLELFRELDSNHNGTIEQEELQSVLELLAPEYWTEDRVQKLVKAADADRDGRISIEEFIGYIFGGAPAAKSPTKATADAAAVVGATALQA